MYSNSNFIVFLLVRTLNVYSYIILARVIMSWIIQDPYNKFYQFLYRITEPVLAPIRNILPSMGLDLSPIIVFLAIDILSRFLLSI
ncbi:MAG: hypothetical protein CVU48_10195 [Candidatus Cloacimonetes bacterium HGW-Cloacimonetes-1]|jgi:YggT family protein|nr:MAG: hypothetical protein CVU48_10195 [Candidatus Cloacimonetes bacterium HGW-Cloacimonetes-1]